MKNDGKVEDDRWISRKKEHLIIDEDVLAVFGIIQDIIDSEEVPWIQDLIKEVSKGRKDVSIQIKSPVERTKFYLTKDRFINKVYECCIYKRYVKYEDILKDKIW